MCEWTAAVYEGWKKKDDESKEGKKAKGAAGAAPPKGITHRQAAELTMLYLPVALIPAVETEPDRDVALLAVYNADDGLYEQCSGRTNQITVFLRRLAYDANDRWIGETLSAIRDLAPLRYQCTDPDLVALDDCVYKMSTGERLPYTPDLVFMAKARTKLPEVEPELPRIENPDGTWWDPASWLLETMGTPELARQIHEVNNRILRPRAFGDDKVIMLYSESGSNGKGTVLEMQRCMVGGERGLRCASIGLENFGGDARDFILTSLLNAAVNLSDESDPDGFMKSSAMLKAIGSHDPVLINRKNRDAVTTKLFVTMVFSINKLPKMKDKSQAIDRRLYIIPFGQRFMSDGTTDIKRNPRIKSDYLKRPEVREWFVWQALKVIGPITEMSTPPSVAEVLEEFREANDPIVDFWRRYEPQFAVTDLGHLPLEMLYDLYKAESRARRGTSAGVESIRNFSDRLVEEAARGGVWREERNARDRVQKSLASWADTCAGQVAPIIQDLGRSWADLRPDGATHELVSGDERVARWGRDLEGLPIGTLRSQKSLALPRRASCLVRDLQVAPQLLDHVPAEVSSPLADPSAEITDDVPDLAPLTAAEIAEIATWANRGVPAGVPPAPAPVWAEVRE
ncbi:hypothetical protein nbrc107696_08420 [Gordonia spumicola]|uniref:SF3 helicase domain-containing protein n=1 Tax=Gordonia spumicola TaxID=589161 RepID=A0A7I9V4R7_9ACTN|nr:hypothetical protein nbrc107696_08420 [Gordonia spumicola]